MVGPEAFMEVRYLMHAKQRLALDAIPRIAGEFAAGVRARLGRPGPRLPARRRGDGRRRARLGARHDRGRGRRAARPRRARRRAGDPLLPAVPAGRGARRPRRRAPRRRASRRRSLSASAASSARTSAWRSPGSRSRSTTSSPASAAGRSRARRWSGCSVDALAGRLGPLTFLDLRADVVERELARLRDGHRSGPHAENMLRDIGIVASGAV